MKLTAAQFRALHYISRCQRKEAKIGSILSRYLLQRLKEMDLVMEIDGIILLTKAGEQELQKVYPKHKYQVY